MKIVKINKVILVVLSVLLFVCCSEKQQHQKQPIKYDLNYDSIVCSLDTNNLKNMDICWRAENMDYSNINHKIKNILMVHIMSEKDTGYFIVIKRKIDSEYLIKKMIDSAWCPLYQFPFEYDSIKTKVLYCVDLMMRYPIKNIHYDVKDKYTFLSLNNQYYISTANMDYINKENTKRNSSFRLRFLKNNWWIKNK